jgi:phospholipase/lecithinase/hemolysin
MQFEERKDENEMRTVNCNLILRVIIPIVMVICSPILAFGENFEKIVVFGDSLSDHYGLQQYIGAYDPVINPTGALDSWTNGDVCVEYLAGLMNAELDNYAIAGAMTEGHENSDIQTLINAGALPQLDLLGQVERFLEDGGSFAAEQTLFVIWIGGNDLLEYIRGESEVSSAEELIMDAVNNVVDSMSMLAGDNALNILVMNIPDFAKAPAFNTRSSIETAAITAVCDSFNVGLSSGIDMFSEIFPAVTVYTFDVYSFLNKTIDDGVFENCTGTYMVIDEDGNMTGETNGPASDYLFWDSAHPTTEAHELVADEVYDDLFYEENDNDDSTCFISTAFAGKRGGNAGVLIFGFLLVVGVFVQKCIMKVAIEYKEK